MGGEIAARAAGASSQYASELAALRSGSSLAMAISSGEAREP
jgi:hypothetical protein